MKKNRDNLLLPGHMSFHNNEKPRGQRKTVHGVFHLF